MNAQASESSAAVGAAAGKSGNRGPSYDDGVLYARHLRSQRQRLPRRSRWPAVNSTRAPESSRRVAIAPAPNPAKIGTTATPSLKQP